MGILTAPFRGLVRVLEEIRDRAEDELYDEDAVKTQLVELNAQLECGALSEEEFNQRESALVERLEEIQAHKRRKRRSRSARSRG